MIGGISLFPRYATTISWRRTGGSRRRRSTLRSGRSREGETRHRISSSMVFERDGRKPRAPAELSAALVDVWLRSLYRVFRQGAYEQYKLPYTIIRPFGAWESASAAPKATREILSGNVKLAMSHGWSPIWCRRSFAVRTRCIWGAVGRSVTTPTEAISPPGFALPREQQGHQRRLQPLYGRVDQRPSARRSDLAKALAGDPFAYTSDKPYEYDVQKARPHRQKAKDVLGCEGQDHPGRDARRGHPMDPRTARPRNI